MGDINGEPGPTRSLTASAPEEEAALLEDFWTGVSKIDGPVVWASFNGKRFDAPYIAARSARHGLTPSRQDLLNTYPYKQRPHADLSNLWPQVYGLEDLCDLLSVPTPKSDMDGSQVAGRSRMGASTMSQLTASGMPVRPSSAYKRSRMSCELSPRRTGSDYFVDKRWGATFLCLPIPHACPYRLTCIGMKEMATGMQPSCLAFDSNERCTPTTPPHSQPLARMLHLNSEL